MQTHLTSPNGSALIAPALPAAAETLRIDALAPQDQIHYANQVINRILAATEKVVVNLKNEINLTLGTLLCGGHILMEGPPGTCKTLLSKALSKCLGLDFQRVSFTNDKMPGDIIGGVIPSQESGQDGLRKMTLHPGPLFTNIFLADEINRASPRTQSALLEAMAESQVTIDRKTHPLENPFCVIATQNPLDSSGTTPFQMRS